MTVVEVEPREDPAAAPGATEPTQRRLDLQRGLASVREVHGWLRSLGELGIALQLVLVALLLVWFARDVVGVHSTVFLLVVLLLPPTTFVVLREPARLPSSGWLRPAVAFRDAIAGMGDVGRVIELGALGLFLLWFTKAIAGVDSVTLLTIEFLTPQVVYLILTRRRRPDAGDG